MVDKIRRWPARETTMQPSLRSDFTSQHLACWIYGCKDISKIFGSFSRTSPLRLTACRSSPTDMVGTGCEHDGVIYRNGQSFKPSCKYQCVCVNGAIGCVALCTESQPPRVWCQNPRQVKVRGQCCEKWICDEPKRGRKTAPRHAVEGRTPLMLPGGRIFCCLAVLGFVLQTCKSSASSQKNNMHSLLYSTCIKVIGIAIF